MVSLYCGLSVLGLGGRLAQTDREERALPEREGGTRGMRAMRGKCLYAASPSMPPPPLLTLCRASCSLVPETEAALRGVRYGRHERRLVPPRGGMGGGRRDGWQERRDASHASGLVPPRGGIRAVSYHLPTLEPLMHHERLCAWRR
jgi:hypothetical protein